MVQQEKNFVSFIESRVQTNNELYAHFHLGTFLTGQALTVGNALRRSLLLDIPSFTITRIEIDGVKHEFATLPGVQENILNILLNLKQVVLTYNTLNQNSHFDFSSVKFNASINFSGPGTLTAGDIKFPPHFSAAHPEHHIATLNSIGNFKATLQIEYFDPNLEFYNEINKKFEKNFGSELLINNTPKPIRQVNFGIHKVSTIPHCEYISIEILSDGSIHPKQALNFSLEKLTKLFFNFTKLSNQLEIPIVQE
jgi:DNA-directed RNA polymerase subunit alpha